MFPPNPIHKKKDPNQGIIIVVPCCTSKIIYCYVSLARNRITTYE